MTNRERLPSQRSLLLPVKGGRQTSQVVTEKNVEVRKQQPIAEVKISSDKFREARDALINDLVRTGIHQISKK